MSGVQHKEPVEWPIIAAQWAAENSHLLPIDARPIAPPLKELAAEGHPVQTAALIHLRRGRVFDSSSRSLGRKNSDRVERLKSRCDLAQLTLVLTSRITTRWLCFLI
jgi:hypothetical protein